MDLKGEAVAYRPYVLMYKEIYILIYELIIVVYQLLSSRLKWITHYRTFHNQLGR